MGRIAEQRRRAAALGTEVRSLRAAVKRRIAVGALILPSLLRGDCLPETSEIAEQIPIGQLVQSVPGIGPATAAEILGDLELDSLQPLGAIADNHRRLLAAEIERT